MPSSVNNQGQLLALMIQDESWFYKLLPHVREGVFTGNHIYEAFSQFIFNYWDTFEALIPKGPMVTSLELHLIANERLAVHKDAYDEALDRLYKPMTDSEKSFILKQAEEVIRDHKTNTLLNDIAATKNKEVKLGYADQLFDALNFSLTSTQDFVSYGDMDRSCYYDGRMRPIPIGFDDLDGEMRGGVTPSSLSIFMGPSRSGKSQILVAINANIIRSGYTTLYVTVEMSKPETARRLDANILDIDYDDLGHGEGTLYWHLTQKRLRQARIDYPSMMQSQLWAYNPKEKTVTEFAADVKSFYAGRKLPDVIIIDYAGLFRPVDYTGNSYEDQGLIFYLLKALARKLNLPIITASQTNRQSLLCDIIDMEGADESLKKMQIADHVYSLNRNRLESQRNLCRIYSAKHRGHTDKRTFYYRTKFARSQFFSISEEEHSKRSAVAEKPTITDLQNRISNKGKKSTGTMSAFVTGLNAKGAKFR